MEKSTDDIIFGFSMGVMCTLLAYTLLQFVMFLLNNHIESICGI